MNWIQIFEAFKPVTGEMELAAIWLENAIISSDGIKHSRVTAGDEVRISKLTDKLADCTPQHPATHRVIGCYGTLNSSTLSMSLLDLNTNEPLILKIK